MLYKRCKIIDPIKGTIAISGDFDSKAFFDEWCKKYNILKIIYKRMEFDVAKEIVENTRDVIFIHSDRNKFVYITDPIKITKRRILRFMYYSNKNKFVYIITKIRRLSKFLSGLRW